MTLLTACVAEGAARDPDRTAVVMGSESLTYRNLEDRSARLAHLIRAAGCKPDDRVALVLPKSVDAIVALLGVLKAGCVYVPVDTQSPEPRVRRILDAARPSLALAGMGGIGLLDGLDGVPIGWMGRASPPADLGPAFCGEDLAGAPVEPVPVDRREDDAAHILFTSGSTGVPKGVVITHANVVSFLRWARDYFQPAPTDRISGHPPLHFDLSTFDIFGTLWAGAELHLVDPALGVLPNKVDEFIAGSRLTQWFSVPSVLTYLARFDFPRQDAYPEMKRLLWCGEVLPTPVLAHWMRRLPHVRFTNLYGPTEATIASSYFPVDQIPADETVPVPIGWACEGETLEVLDGMGMAVPAGEPGDLYIGGAGLSPGYWEDPEKTSGAFVESLDGRRIYRTGDRAVVDTDGVYHFLGREDNQVKSRGYRIELGEIESALNTIAGVGECAVVAVQTAGFEGHTICCAYSPAEGYGDLLPKEVRTHLSALLPSYMLPARWNVMSVLPRNPNGKVDRVRLKELFLAEQEDRSSGKAP